MKNVGSKGFMKVSLTHIPTIGHIDAEYFVRKRFVPKKEVADDLSHKIVLNIVLSRCCIRGFKLLIDFIWFDEVLIIEFGCFL